MIFLYAVTVNILDEINKQLLGQLKVQIDLQDVQFYLRFMYFFCIDCHLYHLNAMHKLELKVFRS